MGAQNIGLYSYTYSISSYFAMFIILGLNNYGNRTIATVRDDKKVLSKTFWSIYCMQLSFGVIITIIYLLYIIILSSNKLLASIMLFYIFSETININWFFFGLEEFKLTVTRNSIIKIISTFCLFIFVKKSNDIYIYAIISVLGMLFSQIILWPFLNKRIFLTKITFDDVVLHIKPNLILFIPVIAISIYTTMDKIMLGLMSNMLEVGYYESSYKLTIIPTMIVSSLGTVMLPRMSNLVMNGEVVMARQYIKNSLIASLFIASPMVFGISAITKEFVPIFYGSGYELCKIIIPILLLSTLFISWANVIRTQYLIPRKKDIIYIYSVVLGALTNLTVNILLIPIFQSSGAAIGTLLAEAIVCIYQTLKVKDNIDVKSYFKLAYPFVVIGLTMYIVLISLNIHNNIMSLFIKVIIGIGIYCGGSALYYWKYLKNYI